MMAFFKIYLCYIYTMEYYTGSLDFHVQSDTISPTFLNQTLAFYFHSNHASLAFNVIPPNLTISKLSLEPRTVPYM